MANGLLITGTNLNNSFTSDLNSASKLYNKPEENTLLGNLISIVKGVVTLDIDAILKALGGIVDLGMELAGNIKDRILGFIMSLFGRDMSGLSKLSLTEQTGLRSLSNAACNMNLNGLNLGGMNMNILGYGLASLLAMLLCAGLTAVFTVLDTIVDLGMATIGLVTGAISDVLKSVVGGNTVQIVSELSGSRYAGAISQAYTNPQSMLLGSIGRNTASIPNMPGSYQTLNNGLNTMSPNWLKNGTNFSLANVKGNNVMSSLANSVNKQQTLLPSTSGYNYTGKTLNNTEKISMFGNVKKLFG